MPESHASVDIPDYLKKSVEPLLHEDEQLVAVMQPIRGSVVTCSSIGMFLSGIAMIILFIGTFAFILRQPMPPDNPLPVLQDFWRLVFSGFSLLIGGTGAAMCFLPIWLYRTAHHIIYALTSRRAIIVRPLPTGKYNVRSFSRDDVTMLEVRQYTDEIGDLIFRKDRIGRGIVEIGFLGISQPYQIRRLMMEVLDFNADDFQAR